MLFKIDGGKCVLEVADLVNSELEGEEWQVSLEEEESEVEMRVPADR